MSFKANGGYVGHSMSRRAVRAYEDGEMPKSKWTKAVLIDRVGRQDPFWSTGLLSSFLLETLQAYLLRKSSWHHTGKYFNETDFYELDADVVNRHDVESLFAADAEMRANRRQVTENNGPEPVKGRIRFESWEGSRKHGRFVRHELPCLILGDWAYTECGRKRLDGRHVLDVERFDRAPRGTAKTYERIAGTLPGR